MYPVAQNLHFLLQRHMSHLNHRRSVSSALHPQVMDDTPTLIGAPLARVHLTDPDK